MLRIHLNKSVTFSKDLKGDKVVMWDCKYKELEKELSGVDEFVATYPFGMRSKRIKGLEKLGFIIKEQIWYSDSAIHSTCKDVFARK